MANTDQEMRDAVSDYIVPVWNAATSSAPLYFDNMPADGPPDAPQLWGRLHIRNQLGTRAALGRSNTKFRRQGTIYFQMFDRKKTGVEVLNAAADAVLQAFEDAGPSDTGNVWFRDPVAKPVGGSDATYFQVNVEVGFTYDRNT
jgi:hypothetical protein